MNPHATPPNFQSPAPIMAPNVPGTLTMLRTNASEQFASSERLDRGLPFRQIRFLLWQIGYVGRRVLQRQQLPAIRQRDGIIEAGAQDTNDSPSPRPDSRSS